jgi:methyl-accepting chemotaxis protein
MKALSEGLEQLSQGNLIHRISFPCPMPTEPVRALFNDMVARLAQLIGTVTIVARRVAESAREINSASTDLASRNEHHAGRISEALMAITQVSAMVGDAARDSVDMQASVEQAHDQATNGSQVVIRATEAMAGIRSSARKLPRSSM